MLLCLLAVALRRRVQLSAEAVVLDMGLYSIPGLAVSHPADTAKLLADVPAEAVVIAAANAAAATPRAAAAAAAEEQAVAASSGGAGIQPAVVHSTTAAAAAAASASEVHAQRQLHKLSQVVEGMPVAAAAAAAESSGGATAAVGCVRLYQVLAPRLLDRAHLYGNKLVLKSGALLHDLPYFCAPASTSRSLLDQLLLQTPGLGDLWKHGSGSTKSGVFGTLPTSRVLSEQQQLQQPNSAPSAHGGTGAAAASLVRSLLGAGTAQRQQQLQLQHQRSSAAAATAGLATVSGSTVDTLGTPAGNMSRVSPVVPAASSDSSSLWVAPHVPLQKAVGSSQAHGDADVTFVFCSVSLPNKAWWVVSTGPVW